MAFDAQDNVFLLPGPVKMHPRVLQAMARPAMAHRTPEFSEVNARLFSGLRQLLDIDHVAVLAGSGTTSKDCGLCGILRATHGRP